MATSLRSQVEEAWRNYLKPRVPAVRDNVFAGISNGDKAAPCIICEAISAEEDPIDSGNFRVSCRITCQGMAADGVDSFNETTDGVARSVYVSGLPSLLQGATTGLVVIGVSTGGSFKSQIDLDCWSEALELEVYCSMSR